VAKLDGLDAVTSELVRLRGARAHGCRLCQSLRNRTALEAADHPGLFEAIDNDADGHLTEAQQAAVALVDAMIWQPMAWPGGLAERLRRSFAPDQALELVLDVVRNAANKIAVAFGADEPHVADGVEYYDIDPGSGDLVYGLPPAARPAG
jgi:alkylhydroperoxidase family enzyme